MLAALGAAPETLAAARQAAGAGEVLELAGACRPALAQRVALQAREVALATLAGGIVVDVALFDRTGALLAHAGP
jgi:cobalt-precorrin-5B (C1)-methyltransferase